MSGGRRVLVVGLDAADRSLVLDMVDRGLLPNVGALLAAGTRADVDTPDGTFVGSVWPNFATGRRPSRHGRYCYEQLIPGTYEVHRTGPPSGFFWTAVAAAGRRVASVDVPHSDVVVGAPGVQVVDWAHHDPNVGFRTSPPELGPSLIEQYGAQPGDACNEYGRRGAIAELRADLVDGIGRKAAFTADLVGSSPWDLFVVVFGESHCIGHQAWDLHDSTHADHDAAVAAMAGDPVEDVYGALDDAVGRLVAAAGADTTVVLVLSHGMVSHYDATFLLPQMLDRIERQEGGPSSLRALLRRSERAAARLRRAVSGRATSRSFVKSVDGSRRYFAIPNNDAVGGIRLNVIGREPHGLIAPGAELEATCALLARRLQEWVNLETGESIVRNIVLGRAVDPDPAVCALPDLYVEWNRSSPIRSIEAPGLGRIDGRYEGVRTGDHRPGGLVVTRGPGIPARGEHPPIRTEDLAPTICAALGVELADVDGVVRSGLLSGAAVV